MKMIPINSKYKNIAVVTFTSSGYIDITQNLCNSNTQNNVNYSINIFCLDRESMNYNFGNHINHHKFPKIPWYDLKK